MACEILSITIAHKGCVRFYSITTTKRYDKSVSTLVNVTFLRNYTTINWQNSDHQMRKYSAATVWYSRIPKKKK